jgi:hypothetical protein
MGSATSEEDSFILVKWAEILEKMPTFVDATTSNVWRLNPQTLAC